MAIKISVSPLWRFQFFHTSANPKCNWNYTQIDQLIHVNSKWIENNVIEIQCSTETFSTIVVLKFYKICLRSVWSSHMIFLWTLDETKPLQLYHTFIAIWPFILIYIHTYILFYFTDNLSSINISIENYMIQAGGQVMLTVEELGLEHIWCPGGKAS